MPTQDINQTQHILVRFNEAQQGMQLIYQPSLLNPLDDPSGTRFNGFLTELRLTARIKSLSETAIPNPALTASRTEKINSVYEYTWKSPHKMLALYLKQDTDPFPYLLGTVSLMRRDPMYQVGLLKYLTESISFAVGKGLSVWGQIENDGYGLLQGTDEVNIFGCAREEYVSTTSGINEIVQASSTIFNITSTPLKVVNANPNRRSCLLVNNAQVTTPEELPGKIIYINLGEAPSSSNQGIPLYPNGGNYEINDRNLFRGDIYAISTSPTKLNVVEGLVNS